MKTIWIINQYGPIEGENWRDYSYNQIGKYLADKCGYNVIWWTSNFAHHFKKYRSKGWKDIKVRANFTIRLVPTSAYKKNIGIGRFIRDWSYAVTAKKEFTKHKKPDIILTSMLPMTFGEPTFKYAMKNHVPYILNTMDIWPEFIEKNLGKFAPLAHILFLPIYCKRKKFYSKASGLMALGSNYLEFAKKEAVDGCDKPSALVYNGSDLGKFEELSKLGVNEKLSLSIRKKDDELLCIFAGTFGPSYDIDAMLKCAEKCSKEKQKIKFIFCGSGPRTVDVQNYANKFDNIVFLGSLKPEELIPLYSICDIGMCAYTSKSNVDMPDKFYDYCAGGLAIVNSLTEEVATYIKISQLGFNYEAGNADEMYQRIVELEHDRDRLNQCKKNSKKISKIFDSRVQNEKLRGLIEDVLMQGGV